MTNQPPIQGSDGQKPHFVLVPLMSPGHMIPMTDMACLLADHGAMVTFVTTPLNAIRIKPIIDRVQSSGLPIHFLSLRFPCAEVGLPEGCEFVDALPSPDFLANFVEACSMLREPLVHHLRSQNQGPSCLISDTVHIWSHEVAREFGIPILLFNGFGCFALVCKHIIEHHKIFENVSDENESFIIPGLPHRIAITKGQSPGNFGGSRMNELRKKIVDSELAADGMVVNTFDDFESFYVECYQKAIGKKVWTIGPMSLCNRNVEDLAVRGNKASIDGERCLRWLDSKKPSSVVYVSFGSLARTSPSQLIEIGLGLEASNCPFIWVIKAGDKSSEVEEWLSEGFEERVSASGLIIRGWAPQVMILSHLAIGGFMTHCGWNSTLESVSAGVPMITWPHFAEQFLNENLIVEVLRIGVTMGVKTLSRWGEQNNATLVKRDDVQKEVSRLMDEGGEGKEMRMRARQLREKAIKSMEAGGSSYENMEFLIQQIHIDTQSRSRK